MKKDEPPKIRFNGDIRYYSVGFFDLLGHSERMSQIARGTGLPRTYSDAKVRNILLGTVREVDTLRGVFYSFLKGATSGLKLARLTPAAKTFARPELIFNWVSDAIIVASPISGSSKGIDPAGFMHTLINSAIASLALLSMGAPMRGGLDVDLAGEFWQGQVYGPALVSAYRLEQTVAEWPRITMGKGAMDLLGDLSSLSPENQLRIALCRSLICVDSGGTPFIDFAGEVVRRIVDGELRRPCNRSNEFKSRFREARRFVSQGLKRFRRSRNSKLISRYERLDFYLESRKSLWC